MMVDPQSPYLDDVGAILEGIHEFFPLVISPELVPAMREPVPGVPTNLELALAAFPNVSHREVQIPAHDGAQITLSIFEPADGVKTAAGIYWIHGGGMIIGDRFLGAQPVASWVDALGAVAVSVEYRLAPEHPYPTPTEDVYSGFAWFAENAESLGVDPANIAIVGNSAGGNLAAALALLARDRGGPAIKGQMLQYPMLDDRDATPSAKDYRGVGLWSGGSNDTGWTSFLGDIARGSADVPAYAAPARATDLSGLPPAFIDVGGAELFRDEDVEYAMRLWAAGVPCELHVIPGIWHAFETFAPEHPISVIVEKRRAAWLKDTLGL